MQSWYSLSSVVILTTLLTTTWILPLLNLHIALNKETSLQERAQSIVDAGRLDSSHTLALLRAINLPGIKVDDAWSEINGDYVIYSLRYSHRGLFSNIFLSREDLEQDKTISLLVDLI